MSLIWQAISGEAHPVADIFPMMREREIDDLAADIAEHGLREPIWIATDGRIIDGRNRYKACLQAGVEPTLRTWDGDERELVSFVVSLNLHRRHLDESQRAMVAARLETLKHGQKKADMPIGMSRGETSDLLNVGERSVARARVVQQHGTPELVEAVDDGRIAVSAAAEIAELEPETQQAIVEDVHAGVPAREAIRERTAHVAHNSGNNEWYTPAPYVEAARVVMGAIDCDPASSPIANETVKAAAYFTQDDDGLAQPQWGRRVWMNPPYAQPLIGQFADDLAARFTDGEVEEACVLVNNATETQWFQTLLSVASAVCFLRGRVKFLDPEGRPSGAPLQGQVVLYLGPQRQSFARAYEAHGKVLFS